MSRVLFIITQSEIGGAQRYLLEFAPYLASRGHEISVAAGEGDGELFIKLKSRIINYELRTYQVPHLVRSLNPIRDIKALLCILKIIKEERPSIVFLQSTKAGFLGSLAVKLLVIHDSRFMIRVIYRIGGWAFNDPRPWWMNKIVFWMEKISAPLKDKIVVNSELDRQLAIDRKIAPSNKVVKIYNGIDTDKLKFLPREEAKRGLESRIKNLEFSNESIVVGTIANLYATKGIEYLVGAARALSSPPYSMPNPPYFVVIGEGRERPRLEALIKKYNLEEKFFLVGRMPNAAHYLKAFDIFVLPSAKEGFPWVALEAMAAEVPVVATRVGAVPEIINDGREGLLVPPRDSKALAAKISQLISIPYTHDREQMVVSAREKLTKFSLQRMLEESERLIRGL